MAETGRLCRHSPSAHSSVDLGVVLRISFAAGPISPFTNSARREKIERIRVFSFRVFATFFFSNPRSNFSHVLLCVSVAVTSALIPRHFFFPRSEEGGVGARLAHFFFRGGSLRSLFNHLIGWVSFVAPEAWEHKSPKPLEKRKLRSKSRQKARLLRRSRTDR